MGGYDKTKARLRILVILIVGLAVSFTLNDPFALVGVEGVTIFLYVSVQGALAIWVSRDARERNVVNPTYWAFAVVLPVVGILGFLAYLQTKRTTDEQSAT